MANENSKGMARGGSSANAQTSEANAGDESPAVAAPGADLSGILARLNSMQASIDNVTNENHKLRAENAELKSTAARPPLSIPEGTAVALVSEDLVDKLEKRLERIERERVTQDVALVSGRELFRVWVPGEKGMDKLVGSEQGPLLARVKFEQYFGITAIIDPTKSIKVEPYNGPLPDDHPSREQIVSPCIVVGRSRA